MKSYYSQALAGYTLDRSFRGGSDYFDNIRASLGLIGATGNLGEAFASEAERFRRIVPFLSGGA